MERSRMLRDGLRARRRVHAAGFAASALVVAAAVVGAVFSAAAQESILRDTVAADPAGASLHLTAALGDDDASYPPDLFVRSLAELPAGGRFAAFPTRIAEMRLPADVQVSAASGKQPSRLVWRDGFCAHLVVVAGRCPTRAGEAMISASTVAGGGGWRNGAEVDVDGAGRLRVVGVYRPRSADDPFWADAAYFDGGARPAADPALGQGAQVLGVDSLLTTRSEFLDDVSTGVIDRVDYPIAPDATVIGDGTALRADVAAIRRAAADTPFTVSTSLDTVLRSAATQRRYVAQGAQLVALQLVLLGSVVLFFLTLDLTEGRRREIALAKLRGQPWPAIARFALAEPLLVLVAALPVGLLVGWATGAVLSLLLLRPGTPAALPLPATASAAAALVGAAVAAALSTRRVVARPVLEQWSEAAAGRPTRLAPVLVVAIPVVAWGAAAAILLTGGTGSPTLVVVPILLLAGVAVPGVALLVLVARALGPRTRATDRIARFLAVRQLARSGAIRRTAVLLVATLGLATFAVGGQSVLARSRESRAEAELGATRVVTAAFDTGTDPVAAVRRADPDGTWAMAAARWLPDDGTSVVGTVLAVDPSRLPAVGLPVRGGLDDRTLATTVDAETLPDVAVRGDRVVVRLRVEDLRGDLPPDAFAVLRTAAGQEVQADLGGLRDGTHDYAADAPCSDACSLTGFVWSHSVADRTLSGVVTVLSVAAERAGRTAEVRARLTQRGAWRAGVPVSESTDAVTIGADGVTDRFRTASGSSALAYASTARSLPAVVSPGGLADERPDGGWALADPFGNVIGFTPERSTPLLPGVLDAGVVLDVAALQRALPDFTPTATWEVWIGTAAPADALQRLSRAGLVLGVPHSVGEREAQLGREGAALAFSLLLALAGIAAALAVLATAVSAGASARGRAREAAAMRLIGVPARSVLRAAMLEQALLLVAAAVLAVPAGIAAVLLVLPRLRQSSTPTPVPLTLLPPVLPLVLLVVVYVVLIGVMAAITAAAVVRAGRPSSLRAVD